MENVIDVFVAEATNRKLFKRVLKYRMIELCMNTTQLSDDEVSVLLLNVGGN